MDNTTDQPAGGMPVYQPIAHIESPYKTKFGVPRQAGLDGGRCRIVFEPPYRNAEALRGLEDFDFLWIIFQFHLAEREGWSPTVRPPRLGGNRRLGVFATRSPFRPNNIGLSSVKILVIKTEPHLGPVIYIEGADLVDGTPVLDIKPYLPYTDSHPEARGGFAPVAPADTLAVSDPHGTLAILPHNLRDQLTHSLALDPRPHYQNDPLRTYAMLFDRWEVKFHVVENELVVDSVDVK